MKTKNYKVIFFLTTSNILFINQSIFNILINNYKQSSWIAIIFFIFISVLLSLFFKGFSGTTNVTKEINNNKFISFFISIYIIIILSIIIFLASIIIKDYFYNRANLFTIIIIISFLCFYLSKYTFPKIIGISLIFSIGYFVFYLIPIFHYKERNLSYLLPLEFDIKNIFSCINLIIFPMENIIFSIYSNQINKGFRKKDYLLSNLFSYIYLLFIIIDSITLLGANYYQDLRLGEFIRWEVFQGNKFIETYELFFLIIVSISVIFRGIIYFNIIRRLHLIKQDSFKKYIPLIITLIIQILFYLYINNFHDIVFKTLNYLTVLIIIIYIYFIWLSNNIKNKTTNLNVTNYNNITNNLYNKKEHF